jgi:hypothetical protein
MALSDALRQRETPALALGISLSGEDRQRSVLPNPSTDCVPRPRALPTGAPR